MSRTLSHPPAISFDCAQHFVLEDASWELYEKLLRDIGDRPIRVTYDDGRMEIMSPLAEHEDSKKLMKHSLYLSLLLIVSLFCGNSRAADATFRIVTLGDSITKGVRGGVKPDETFSARLQAMLREKGVAVEVINAGIGGERTDQALRRLDKDVIARKPNLVTIMYGTNDSYVDKGKDASRITVAEYRANLEKLIADLRAAGIKPILMTEPRWGRKAALNGVGEHPNIRLEKYVQACREVAREKKVPLVDHFQIWTDREAGGQDIGAWTTDQCHPNPQGHQFMAETIFPVVQREIANPR